jgi:general stress protein 26
MDSINKNQPENNLENLNNTQAVEKIKELVRKANSCFFCTQNVMGPTNGVRPMSVQKADDEGNLWFFSANDSYKNREIAQNNHIKLYFQGSAHSDFLFLEGIITITTDKNKIHELWNPMVKVWFTEGKDDPRITVLKFTPHSGYYWDTKHGNAIAGIKMLIGAAMGKTLDDSIEGNIRV